MNVRVILFCVALLCAWPAPGREKTDVIVMRNGDRFTCEIKSLSADTLYISLDYALGTVSIDWFKVDHLESKQLFVVKTQNGETYSGTLSMPRTEEERPASLEVLEPASTPVEIQRSDVAKMEQTSERFWQRFNGSVGMGVIYNKGNESTQ